MTLDKGDAMSIRRWPKVVWSETLKCSLSRFAKKM